MSELTAALPLPASYVGRLIHHNPRVTRPTSIFVALVHRVFKFTTGVYSTLKFVPGSTTWAYRAITSLAIIVVALTGVKLAFRSAAASHPS